MNITLYQCAEDVRAVLDHHFDSETEAADTLEAVIGQFEVKAQSVAAYFLNLEATEQALDEHIKAMTEKKKALQNRAAKLKDYLSRNMLSAKIKEISADDGTFKASFRKSTAVDIFDEAQLPEEFMREKISYTPDKTAIKKAIESGREVAGAKLETRQNLQIK
ncbi:siphovirus Gp157 family protein [Neisseria weixii]|uniref:Siphovirus Gp157 family protein n=1 Tax=Neisseria weixii TaxID=1853276 RepID=A0A3N4MHW4_9NEIS|nr:siphovirus Gp157 family protein [Neisseria weixii]RPD83091.1 siphovirus Gp157 family protein [Neisseria weixii]RPD83337.1 siphovirus Gp157 family protein [Neisseria weixii]